VLSASAEAIAAVQSNRRLVSKGGTPEQSPAPLPAPL